MNYKKLILVLLVPLFLSGCASVNYNLSIDKNLKVEEQVFITATTDYFKLFYKNYPVTIVKEYYSDEETMSIFKNNNYAYELVTEDVIYPGIMVTKNYNSLNEYTDNTIFKGQSFENIVTATNDNLVTIKSVNFLAYEEDATDLRYPISSLKINIKVPYVVTSHNADSYDLKTNTYTWVVDEDTEEKEINLTFDKNRIYVYNLVMYISIIILCILIIILILVIRKIIKKNKINNQIFE